MLKTIAIVGPESSGKTSLAIFLASHFKSTLAPEYAREYLNKMAGNYTQEDLIPICEGQIQKIKEAQNLAEDICFSDTDPFSIQVWSEIKYGEINPDLAKISSIDPSLDYLLCFPDLPYESDPLRESPDMEDREKIYTHFYQALQEKSNFLGTVRGVGKKRENSALELIKAKYSSYF